MCPVLENIGDLAVIGKGAVFQPAALKGDLSKLPAFDTAHQSGFGNSAVTLAHAHVVNHLTIFKLLDPPICHG